MTMSAPTMNHPDYVLALFIQTLATAHTGRDSGIRGDDLAAKCNIAPRMVRDLVSKAREQGTLIAGTPNTGYFIATSVADVTEYCDYLTHRALHSLKLVARAKNIGLPALMGQLNLST
jgi:hypothetical protein